MFINCKEKGSWRELDDNLIYYLNDGAHENKSYLRIKNT